MDMLTSTHMYCLQVQMTGKLQQLIQGTLAEVPATSSADDQPGAPPGLQQRAHGASGKRAIGGHVYSWLSSLGDLHDAHEQACHHPM